ncbi:MAG TPA: UvrB/UvrC motif-containing protein [Limnochorda sp.]
MLCEDCHEREATVHITHVVNGEKSEAHLCEACAQKRSETQGLAPFGLQSFLKGLFDPETLFGTSAPPGFGGLHRADRCERCGLSLDDFRRLGHLGCAHCYEQFRRQLQPALQRIHGATSHRGKVPSRGNETVILRRDLQRLREQLAAAIGREAYEEAASLRDRIHALEKQLGISR